MAGTLYLAQDLLAGANTVATDSLFKLEEEIQVAKIAGGNWIVNASY